MLYTAAKRSYPSKCTILVKEKAITVFVGSFNQEGANGSGLQT